MAFRVDWDEDAREELMRLPVAERRAVMNAVAKLEAFGDQLGAPHASQVKGNRAGSCGPALGDHPGGRCTAGWATPWWCSPSARKLSMTGAGLTGRRA